MKTMKHQKSTSPRSKIIVSLTTLHFMLIALSAGAEETKSESRDFAIGVHGGVNMSDYNYNNNSIHQIKENKTGALLGLHFQGLMLGVFGVRVEANYSDKGYDLSQFASVTHHYLQIPLLFKLSPIPGPVQVFVEAGPAASLHLSSTTEVANTTINFQDDSNDWDLSVIAGAGLGFKIGGALLEFEGRYDYGLKNLNNSSTIDVKSRAIQLLTGISVVI